MSSHELTDRPLSFAIILPPVGVFLERGCGADLLINILLTILGKHVPYPANNLVITARAPFHLRIYVRPFYPSAVSNVSTDYSWFSVQELSMHSTSF
ncbi:hypothetical protein K503DRAFT_796222 [Rhizopogon vinicolor AM-OR11-026]|uniref:Uncharacterized protein n=1 Tax=Rhizopogon vinicolor AM-OR11-026 TaxID=1314800 RepID=A0A1B7NFK3_9AGAM|nr:hypothetical protein K503DRAFT_796222 [Rhizopogon vinicolor AM-OR11-026]